MNNGFIGLIAAIAAYSTSLALGASLPYSNSFEAYPAAYAITNDADWTASAAITAVTNVPYLNTTAMNTAYMGAPLGDTHTNVLSFENAPLTNSYSGADPVVSIDVMVRPNVSQELSYSTAISNSQLSIAFLTNGVAVWHGVQTAAYSVDYATWSVLNASSTPISSGKWCRVTVSLNYHGEPSDGEGGFNPMFKVQIDGQPLMSTNGHMTANLGDGTTNGPWLSMAKPLVYPTQISSLVLNGSGMIDDLNVQPSTSADYITSTYGIPYNWFIVTGVTNDTSSNAMAAAESSTADADVDGMPNWAEYYAGTGPTNPGSKLVIVSQVISNGIPRIKWLGSAGALAPYRVDESTNLVAGVGWQNVTNNIAYDTSGTNEVVLSAVASTQQFYRVTILK